MNSLKSSTKINSQLGVNKASRSLDLFYPPDIDLAYSLYKATCGPVSLAAIMESRVCDLISLFPQFPEKNYTNYTSMRSAIQELDLGFSEKRNSFASFGVSLIQFTGPWSRKGVPKVVELRYTHWIAVKSTYIFDINSMVWQSYQDWCNNIIPLLGGYYQHTSGWHVKRSIEFTRD